MSLAFRNLFQSKARLAVSVGGVALALSLILSLDAIFAGVERQVTAYVDHSGADVIVSQRGVRNMHMASSSLPASVVAGVRAVPGVESATPILYLTNMVVAGGERHLAYVIGLPQGALAGGPARVAAGAAVPAAGEASIDRGVADVSGIAIGDRVKILGQEFTVSGLSEGTVSIINSVAFISMDDFARLRGSNEAISFVLVKVAPGASAAEAAARIESNVDGVTVQTRQDFASQERKVIRDMSTDVISIMNLSGFLVGLAVLALTVYIATFARRAEYGVLKAIGARNAHLYGIVVTQAISSVLLGLAAGVGLTLLLAAFVPRLELNLTLVVTAVSLFKVGAISIIIAGLSAILPIAQMAGLDPAMVFREGEAA